MKRRKFLQNAAMAGAGVLCAPVWKSAAADFSEESGPKIFDHAAIPTLDELAGDWFSGKMFEQTPSICNFHGGIQAGHSVPLDQPVHLRKASNVLSISSFANFPLAQGGEVAQLALDGKEIAAEEYRWYAYQILRRARSQDLEILTTVRMPFEQSGVLFRVKLTNSGSKPRTVALSVALCATVRAYPETWHWDPPRPEARDFAEFKSFVRENDGAMFLIQDARSAGSVAFAFVQQPDSFSEQKQSAVWTFQMLPGESRQIEFVMAAGMDFPEVQRRASLWKANFEIVYEDAKEKWEKRFCDAFTPDNGHFSGNLPSLQTSDAKLRRLYYMSVLSLVELERTNLHADFPRVFVTAAPRWAPTLVYFWDTCLFPTLYSLLDPAAVKQMLVLFLSADIHSCYAIDVPSKKGVGPWYSFNDYVIFQIVLRYVLVTRDWEFLDQDVAGKKVIDRMEESALYWRRLVKGKSPLASYGTADNLLETVPTYQQRVPSLNAANVWMMRTMAKLRERAGGKDRAAELRKDADELARHVLELYVKGEGYWACEFDDGKRVEVRHCIDFFTTIFCMPGDLGEQRMREMNIFVDRELWTDDWLYALSPLDGAAKDSLRPDHGSTGAFDAWPAFTAEAMFLAGRREDMLARLHGVVPVTKEGPFGQARYCASDDRPTRKAVSMDYYESSAAAAFAEMIIRTICGFSPGLDENWSWTTPDGSGITGALRKVRYKGKLLDRELGRRS